MNKSVITKNQMRTYGPKTFKQAGEIYRITAFVRYDDRCSEGKNSFGISANIDIKRGDLFLEGVCGPLHGEIVEHFPELESFIKWHLSTSEGAGAGFREAVESLEFVY